MNRSASFFSFAVTTALALTLAGCASTGGPGGAPSGPASGPSPAAAGSPSAPACTSDACLTKQIESDLLSVVAKDGAVITKASCRASALKRNAGGSDTVYCKVTESDGAVSEGYANLIPSQEEITWDPTQVITEPGS
jgi:hypothetical protein